MIQSTIPIQSKDAFLNDQSNNFVASPKFFLGELTVKTDDIRTNESNKPN